MNKGKLIVIEGLDGAGKATQAKILSERLVAEGYKVFSLDFPQYKNNIGGKLLYEVLKSEIASKYNFVNLDPKLASMPYSIDRYESQSVIEQAIKENDFVILDRYTSANVLHQGAKMKTDEEKIEYVDWLYNIEFKLFKNPIPDIIILLTIPVDISMTRASVRGDAANDKADVVESDLNYMTNSYNSAIFFAKKLDWKVIDGMQNNKERTVEDINNELYRHVIKLT